MYILDIPHLGDQDVFEAPVLVLGRLDVVLPGLTSGLYHLNIFISELKRRIKSQNETSRIVREFYAEFY